eukprot:CAMPEP_0182555976 /NCGR_PEP_ID=MMETSP1324-20130603/391_1 /TAXON_ID=236786 /ORGANISM="Florenciella sp., Strain RCC1587" /LENGTH=230 /DNA_ID=CAMNT_0024767785 /DNA_START=144 /DNA_END=838 /DNA_ORIENTATION=-
MTYAAIHRNRSTTARHVTSASSPPASSSSRRPGGSDNRLTRLASVPAGPSWVRPISAWRVGRLRAVDIRLVLQQLAEVLVCFDVPRVGLVAEPWPSSRHQCRPRRRPRDVLPLGLQQFADVAVRLGVLRVKAWQAVGRLHAIDITPLVLRQTVELGQRSGVLRVRRDVRTLSRHVTVDVLPADHAATGCRLAHPGSAVMAAWQAASAASMCSRSSSSVAEVTVQCRRSFQ